MQYVPKYEDKVDYIVKLIKDINSNKTWWKNKNWI